MQQTTIQFQESGTQMVKPQVAPIDVWVENSAEFITNVRERLKAWYGSESRYASVLAGESVTWRAVVRVHAFVVCLGVAIAAVEQNVVVAGASMAAASWAAYLLKDEEKKGGEA